MSEKIACCLGIIGFNKVTFYTLMLNPDSSSFSRAVFSIRWPWLLLGCGCLLAGSVYLSLVNLKTPQLDITNRETIALKGKAP